MSKLYDKYLFLKSKEVEPDTTLFLFKSGLFFIFLDNDAKIASKLFNLKLTFFTNNVEKCGFPSNSLNKYLNMSKQTIYTIKIIDSNLDEIFSINDYNTRQDVEELLRKVSIINTDDLSIKEAYEFIDNLKLESIKIIESIKNK